MKYHNIIIKPLYTEKMSILQESQRKYAFQVSQFANKIEIKKAVQMKFDVEVEKVATMNRRGKIRQMTVRSGGRVIRTSGRKSSWKRAIVTLKDGFSIDLMGGEVSG
jgi:large subunit ribosomal protein L23|tara:strand:- start:132 stop:452 length:321 start_codon:yes stop_codon:yes gene_type:complete